MGDTFRGFGEMLVKLAIFLGVMVIVGAGAIYLIIQWLDGEFGRGTATPFLLIMGGIVAALAIFVVVTLLNNMTHRSAGDDVVAIFSGMVDAMGQHNKNQAQVERERWKTRQIVMKDQADANKTERGLAAFFQKSQAKADARKAEADARKKAEEDAELADWAWYEDASAQDIEILD